MHKYVFGKKLVVGILCLLIFVSFSPAIYGINLNSNIYKFENISNSSISIYTYGKTSSNQKSIDISKNVVLELGYLLEELKDKIVNEPFSDETNNLKSELAELLFVHGMIPEEMSKKDIISLLNPSWLDLFNNRDMLITKFHIFNCFNNFLNKINFFQRFLDSQDLSDFLYNFPKPAGTPASLIFCSLSSFGNGLILPLFVLPRPRGLLLWTGSETSSTNVGGLLSGQGFEAKGSQIGIALGCLGIGLTYSVLGVTLYAFIGYSTLVYLNAEEIQWYA